MKKYFFITLIIILFLLLGVFIGIKLLSQDTNQSNADTNLTMTTLNSFIPQNINKVKITITSDGTENNNYSNIIYYLSDLNQINSFIDNYNQIEINETDKNNISDLLYEINFSGDTSSSLKVYSNNLLSINDENNFFEISNDSLEKITESTDVKYYLHDSNLEKPSSDSCYNAQSKVLSNLSESEISTLKNSVRNIHSLLEFGLTDRVKTLKDANNIYWEPDTVDEVFTQPNGVKFQSYGFWEYRDELQDLLKLNLNDNAKAIVNDILLHLQTGMDNHDLSECFEAHKILHDFDYWCINYPVSLNIEPADWGGLDCYYGLIENYNL